MTARPSNPVSRRTALAGLSAGGLSAGGLGLALTAVARPAAAQDAAGLAGHPMSGVWLALANPPLPDDPQTINTARFGADGSVLLTFPLSQVGPQGVVLNSAYVGTWEADDERTAHFTAVQILSAPDGTPLGTTTVDGYPQASEDGQTFIDDGARVVVTIRDPAGAIVDRFSGAGARPVTGTRMSPGNPGFPEGSPATPTA